MATTTTTATAQAQALARQDAASIPYTHVHKIKWGHYLIRGLFWLLVVFILIYTIFPFYYAILSSLTPSSLLFSTPAVYWPEKIDWSHYEYVFRNNNFLKALVNSTIVSFSITILALTLGSFGAYALGRFRFRGRTIALYVILSMTMFPGVAIVGSLFSVVRG